MWVGRYSSTSNFGAVAKSIALDDQGNVYVTGFSYASGSDYDFATVKYNPVGAQQWAVRYNGTGNYTDYANSIAVDGTGNVYITGESSASGLGSADYTTIKYNSSGIQQWISRLSEGSGQSIAVNDSGNVYVTGTFDGDTGR
ncbi:MAG: SBBP repeat-containing protein [Ignavibacteria bacterium]|nr:SBBP repeat-containing protein [Ignavibacteria bacterium]